jgi:gluconolactonase
VNYPTDYCFSADESKLYVADSFQRNNSRLRTLRPDGTLTNIRIFAKNIGTASTIELPDGIRCDRAGRIFCTVGSAGRASGVRIYDPNGQLLGTILTPESVSNLCFGGSNQEMIFVTAAMVCTESRACPT